MTTATAARATAADRDEAVGREGDPKGSPPFRSSADAGPVETTALAALPVAWLWSTGTVLEDDWLWPVVGTVATIAVLSAVARAFLPALAASLVAALAGPAWITAVSAPDEALLGVIPTPESFAASVAAIGEGVQSIAWALDTPVGIDPPVLAAIVAGAVALAMLVELLGHALRAPALAVLFAASPLLLPIAFRADIPWWHALPGAIVAALALAAPAIDDRIELGRGWAGPLALVAVAALLAAAVPLVAPSPRQVALDLPTIDDLFSTPTPVLQTDIDLGDELRRPEARQVFTYSTSDGQPTVTRLMTLPQAGEQGFRAVEPLAADPAVLVEGAELGAAMQLTVRMSPVRAESLPMPERVAGTEAPDGAVWDDANDALRIEGSLETDGLEYTSAGSRSPELAALTGATATGHDELLALPEAAAGIGELGASLVTDGMGAADRIRAVHGFMTSGLWNYSEQLDLPGFAGAGGDGWAALEGFLETRSGYCVHYASATAALLRGAGVPSRVVVGFLPGDEIAGGRSVTTNHMHAWAEAWLDGSGWVRVETTPGAGTGVASPEGGEQTQEPSATPEPSETPSAAPTPTPSGPAPTAAPTAAPVPSAPGADADGGAAIDWAALRGWLLGLGALLLLALPWLVRQGQRALRLSRGAPGGWQELRAALADAGERLPASATPGEVQAAIAARVDAPAAAASDRVRLAAERAVFDAGPREPGAVDADVRVARDGLARSQPLWRRALSTALPPSLLRVIPPVDDGDRER